MNANLYLLLGITAIVAGVVGTLVFTMLRAMSTWRDMSTGKDKSGAETAFMAAAMEEAMARLRLREQALAARAEASERLSDQIIVSLTSGLMVVGNDRQVQSLNPAGRKLLGLPDTAITGNIAAVLAGAPSFVAVIDECLNTGEPVRRRKVDVERPDGATHMGVSVSPIVGAPGAAHGAICLFSDLTDVEQLEEQLRLKDSLAQVGELTAGIAHEFRNGLATIHGYARLLDLDKLPPEAHAYVKGIREETDALGGVVRNFLNFAKPAEVALGIVETRASVERAADEIRADAAAAGGAVAMNGEFVRVHGDEVLLRQAFSNLCRNALEACLEAKIQPRIAIESSPDAAQRTVRIAVIDNGPGVDPAIASKIFQPFVTTRARGTGLGLALVQKIVVTHNGRVAVQSEPGGGTRFTVTLPIA